MCSAVIEYWLKYCWEIILIRSENLIKLVKVLSPFLRRAMADFNPCELDMTAANSQHIENL